MGDTSRKVQISHGKHVNRRNTLVIKIDGAYQYISYLTIVNEIERYASNHNGSVTVPIDYVTPDTHFELGKVMKIVETGGCFFPLEHYRRLYKLGVKMSLRRLPCLSFDDVIKGVIEYKELFGNYEIDESYVDSNGDHIGKAFKNISNGKRYLTPEQRKVLEDMGIAVK